MFTGSRCKRDGCEGLEEHTVEVRTVHDGGGSWTFIILQTQNNLCYTLQIICFF